MHIQPLDLSPAAVFELEQRWRIMKVDRASCEEWDHYDAPGWYIDANVTCNAVPFGPYPDSTSAATAYHIGLRLHRQLAGISDTEADSVF